MPERPNPSVQSPGYSAPWDVPGQAKKLAARAQAGRGELAAEQSEANRLFRTRSADEYTAPLPRRIENLDEVTAGLGLDRATEARVLKMVDEQRVDFQKRGQTQRVFLAANALTESLRRIRDVPSDARMEITKRARAFWRNTQPTDYAKEPTVRAPQGTQMRSDTSITTKSGVRFIIRDPLMKAARAKKPMPEGMNATPPLESGAAPPAPAQASAGASTSQPPAGFQPIPHSSKGGFRKREGSGWVYWYPGAGVTSTAHPDDAGGARAKRAAEGSKGLGKPGKGPKAPKGAGGAQEPPQAGAGAAPGAPGGGGGAPAPGASQKPAQAGGQGAAPPTMAGAPAAGGAQPAAPKQATDKPHVQKDANGEKRVFHPDVHAHVPAGKENDHEHHAAEFQRHRAEKSKATRTGDAEKAKAHTYAMNFHADKHNRLLAQMQGKEYKPKRDFPGADSGEDDGSGVVASQYERAGSMGNDGRQQSAADPRERFVPESESVKGMREKIGKAVNIMADLSQAHDHLSSLKAKRLEAKRSGHPLARRMIAQIDAEIAATKHDIVQLEDAHGHAMKEVVEQQSMLRNERIRANPIFQAFMAAMAKLSALGASVGASLGEKAGEALEGAKGAIDDIKTRGEREAQAKEREQFDAALAGAADADPDSGEVKPLGVSKDDIAARFGDPEADAAEKERGASAMEALKKLGTMQGDEPDEALADPADVEDDEEGGAKDSEADAALADIFGMHEKKQAAAKQQQDESAAFDGDIAGMRAKRDKAARAASAQADAWEKRNSKRNPKSVMKEALGGDDEATRPTDPGEERGTMASGVRRKKSAKIAVEKSMRLVKSEEWREVVRLAHKLDDTLRKSVPVRYVAPVRHVARAPMTFLDLFGG